jgi:transposase
LLNESKAVRERLTLIRLFETLRGRGYEGGYDAVRRYAKHWRQQHGATPARVFVPLSFAPSEAHQFDWSHECVVLNGVTTIVKVAHFRLCHSRMLFVRAYPRETQEMVFDAHERGFRFFKGVCSRGIYDNMKTAVETVFLGKDRAFNRRFLQMCSHYLIEPTACTPGAGWEKGQVENQVGLARERFFAPRLRFQRIHPEFRDRTIFSAFEAEQAVLIPYVTPFDGFHAVTIVRVAAAQMGAIQKADRREAVVKRMLDLLEEAKGRRSDLVVYPELALTTFFPRWYMTDQAEIDTWFEREMPNQASRPLFEKAAQCGIGISFGYAEITPPLQHFDSRGPQRRYRREISEGPPARGFKEVATAPCIRSSPRPLRTLLIPQAKRK